tara:strand:+ start:51 stop:194 length:144 start_codon:yes stop_codon:yes gene_type:complete
MYYILVLEKQAGMQLMLLQQLHLVEVEKVEHLILVLIQEEVEEDERK